MRLLSKAAYTMKDIDPSHSSYWVTWNSVAQKCYPAFCCSPWKFQTAHFSENEILFLPSSTLVTRIGVLTQNCPNTCQGHQNNSRSEIRENSVLKICQSFLWSLCAWCTPTHAYLTLWTKAGESESTSHIAAVTELETCKTRNQCYHYRLQEKWESKHDACYGY